MTDRASNGNGESIRARVRRHRRSPRSSSMKDRDYLIRLRPIGSPDPPARLRLRRLLKVALRALRLRYVSIAEVERTTDGKPE